MNAVDNLLARLEGVKGTGPSRWIARCPAHADKRPSLSIRELGDGRVLAHCFGGCGIEEVLGAVRLGVDALCPDKPIQHAKGEQRPFHALDVLECLATEAMIIAVAAANLQQGVTLSDADRGRLLLAAERIQSARRLWNGER